MMSTSLQSAENKLYSAPATCYNVQQVWWFALLHLVISLVCSLQFAGTVWGLYGLGKKVNFISKYELFLILLPSILLLLSGILLFFQHRIVLPFLLAYWLYYLQKLIAQFQILPTFGFFFATLLLCYSFWLKKRDLLQ